MRHFDVIVIGGGILGCFTARNLRRWNVSVCLLEKEGDVCTGITRANSAVVYAGYDNKPGSLKAAMTVRGNERMEELCRELEVPFSRCGSLLVTYDEASIPKMERKLQNGIQNGVPGIRLLSGPEAEAMEPMLRPGVKAALLAPSTGTVNPWQLGIAAYENPARFYANTKLTVSAPGMMKIAFTCNTSSYANTLKGSIATSTSYSVSINGSVVIVTFKEAVDSFVIEKLSAQVRVNSLSVEAESATPPTTDPTVPPATDPTVPPATDPTDPPATEPPVTDPTDPPAGDPTDPGELPVIPQPGDSSSSASNAPTGFMAILIKIINAILAMFGLMIVV